MKVFLYYLSLVVIITLGFAFLLDGIYTKTYLSNSTRNKIGMIINSDKLKNKNYDIIMLGSSRANNHFVTQEFTDKGFVAYNFGMSGAKLEETALLFELFLNTNHTTKRVLLEADLTLAGDYHSEGTRAGFMPYIRNEVVARYYKDKISDFNLLYNIPFYRYMKYDSKINFREFFLTLQQKKTKNLNHGGFVGLNGDGSDLNSYKMTGLLPRLNQGYEHIKQLCKKNNIELIVVTTPMCQKTVGWDYFEQLKTVYPEIHHYEKAVQEDRFFSSCGHLNKEGAVVLTRKIINELILN